MQGKNRLRRAFNWLLDVPGRDPDDARRRRLVNILLLCLVVATLVVLLPLTVAVQAGLELEGWNPHTYRLLSVSVPALLFGVTIIWVANRFRSRQLAVFLLLSLITALIFADNLAHWILGGSLIAFTIPVFLASVLLRPYDSFVMWATALLAIIAIGLNSSEPVNWLAIVILFVVATISWLSARSLTRILADLQAINRELDQRVAERTRDLQRRSIQLQTSAEVARDATATLDVEKLLDGTVRLISERFGFYHAAVFLVDEAGEYAVMRATSSPGGKRMLERGHKQAIGKEGIVGHVISTGEPLVMLDMGDEAANLLNPDLSETRSAIALPLTSRDRIIGALDVQSKHETIFTTEDVATLQTMADQLANAIESARLYKEEQRHVEELTALHNIDVAITSTLKLDEVLQIIYEQVSDLIEVETFHIALYNQELSVLECSFAVEWGERLQSLTLKCDLEAGGYVADVMRSKTPVREHNLDPAGVAEGSIENRIVSETTHSMMMIPLVVRERSIGIIMAQSPQPGAFEQDDLRLFSDIAHQAAIAITNARLYEESERRLNEARLIQEVMMAAASTLDFDQVLERAVKALHRALGLDRLGFLLPDEESDTLVTHPSLLGFTEESARVPIKDSLVGQVYRTGYPMLVREKTPKAIYLVQSADVSSALAVPVRVGGRIVAVLCAESPHESAFGESELRLFTTIAGQLGVTLENARLYQGMAQHTQDLRLLADASAGMIGTLEPQSIIDALLSALTKRFESPCGILLMNLEHDQAALAAEWTPDGEPLLAGNDELAASDHPWLEQVIETKQLIYVDEVQVDKWWPIVAPDQSAEPGRDAAAAVLVLPMLSHERLVGVVALRFGDTLPEPVGDQLDWAQTLVNQSAVALANAQLYQQLETQADELSTAYYELQEADRLRTQLVQNVSHELRTPLGLIKGYVELLIEGDLGKIVDGQRAALQVIRERTAMLSRLINNLTMLQAVPQEALVLAPLSIADVVGNVMTEFRRYAEDGRIVFEEEISDELPQVVGDQERLELVFGHLVDNAVKFSPDGGTVSLRGWAEDGNICVSVSDQGIGIASEHLSRIFERFYQVDGSTRRRFGGMGVGLALVWEIVDAHNGLIRVDSEPDKGSSFTVVLPQSG